jgi:N-acetylmuramoyl-L-alanine amidase
MQSTVQLPGFSGLEIPLSTTAAKYRRALRFAGLFLCICFLSAAPKPESRNAAYVPFLEVIDYFDFSYRFSAATGVLTVEQDSATVAYVLGSREVYSGDSVLLLQNRLELREGTIYAHPQTVDLFVRQVTGRPQTWSYVGGLFSVQDRSRNFSQSHGSAGAESASTTRNQRVERGGRDQDEIGEITAIIIDAGHGGKDPGGIGHDQLYEKDIVLEVAKELKKDLHRRFRRKNILLTRSDDTFVSLEERGNMANGIDPGQNPIFISIHANVSFSSNTRGYETYYLSLEEIGENAREVANRENSVLDFEIEESGDYVAEIINRLVDIEYRRESMLMAEYIQEGIEQYVETESRNRGVKSAFFYVLKESKMPAVLVEIGFLTNEEEAELLQSSEYRRDIVRGVADGIEAFVNTFDQTRGFTKQYELTRE